MYFHRKGEKERLKERFIETCVRRHRQKERERERDFREFVHIIVGAVRSKFCKVV
jgi:hypothetical protein